MNGGKPENLGGKSDFFGGKPAVDGGKTLPETTSDGGKPKKNGGKLFTSESGWRIEVKGGGKYYGFRKGSGKERVSRYGGKFSGLDEERKSEYQKNKKSKSRTKQKATS